MIQWPAQTEPVLWGAVAGAVILSVVGFSFSGWHTASQTDAITSVKVATALTAAMAPVCALAFKQDGKYAANMVELKKTDEWSRSNLIEKGGWGNVAGGQDLSPEAARACALLLIPA